MKTAHAPLRHYHRLALYDYSRGAAIFITIATSPRRALFGVVREAKMALSAFGLGVEAALRFAIARAPGLRLYGFVVMPDHCHFRLYLEPGRASREAMVYLNKVIGRFKSYTTHLYQTKYGGRGALWQEGFHDWVCESREMIDAVERYMAYNALKWELRHNRGNLIALKEPLVSPCLGGGEFWRGVGALGLLEAAAPAPHSGGAARDGGDARDGGGALGRPEQLPLCGQRSPCPLVTLRVSRRCSTADVASLKARVLAKSGAITIISGFISPGEREIFAALLATPGATAIKVSPYALPHDYSPSVALMPAISEGRLAIIARGNSPEEISRAVCLDLNARIIEIADHAAYAQPDGVKWLK